MRADTTPHYLEFVEEDRESIIEALEEKAQEIETYTQDFALGVVEREMWAHKTARLSVLAERLRNEQLYSGRVRATVLQPTQRTVPFSVDQTREENRVL